VLWFVSCDGSIVGPHHEDEIVRMIADGLTPAARIQAVGSDEWQSLSAHPPFAVALRRSIPTVRPASPLRVRAVAEVQKPAKLPRFRR
jgi:hypothetical protein